MGKQFNLGSNKEDRVESPAGKHNIATMTTTLLLLTDFTNKKIKN